MKKTKTLTLKTLTKGTVWDIQENDVFRLWESAMKDAEMKDNMNHYLDILKSAFDIEVLTIDKPAVRKKYEARGFKIATVRLGDEEKVKWAVKKHPILRVTDLTYENIRHISAAKLIEVLDRNFGGGWDSISQSIKDIIESGFDISTTTLPKDRLHKPGSMYEKKVNDGFEVLEIPKGTWTEAIFAKAKPEIERPRMRFENDDEENEDETEENETTENDDFEDDDFDEDMLTEESYRTTFETDPEDLTLESVDATEEDENF
ncbi:MAG: hypothetical protein IJM81_04850 [Prevotella sp.]|nr:hypothetical protein [Prevotella sp.]